MVARPGGGLPAHGGRPPRRARHRVALADRDALGGRRLPQASAQPGQTARFNVQLPAPVVRPISADSVSDEQIFFGEHEQGVRPTELRLMDDITPRVRDERP